LINKYNIGGGTYILGDPWLIAKIGWGRNSKKKWINLVLREKNFIGSYLNNDQYGHSHVI
jgi:hypothetical protein